MDTTLMSPVDSTGGSISPLKVTAGIGSESGEDMFSKVCMSQLNKLYYIITLFCKFKAFIENWKSGHYLLAPLIGVAMLAFSFKVMADK